MKKYIFSLLCILLALPLRAQEVDHIYLKSGSLIRGQILELEPDKHIKIEDLSGNIWFYPMDEVEKIAVEEYQRPAREMEFASEPGLANITSIGFLAGSSGNAQPAPFSLQSVFGYYSRPGLFAGAGTGIEFLSVNYLPLFGELRFDLRQGDVVPYLLGRGGYSLPLEPDFEEYDVSYTYSGGALAAFGAGLKIRSRNKLAWDVSLLYRYQRTSYTEHYGWNQQEYQYTDIYNRIEIRLGFYMN